MADQSINKLHDPESFSFFIKNNVQNLPDWMIKEKEAAFDQYSEIGLAITKTPTWKDTDLKKMLTDFFNKDFENELPSFSDYETDSSIDHSLKIFAYGGKYYINEESPNYLKILSNSFSECDSGIFNTTEESSDQYLPLLLNNIVCKDELSIKTNTNQHVDELIHIVHLPHENMNVAPRLNIELSENSSIKILEEFHPTSHSIINNQVDIKCQNDSALEFYRVNHSHNGSHQIDSRFCHLEENSEMKLFTLDFGAEMSKTFNSISLIGERSISSCNTLFLPSGEKSSHHNVLMDHLADQTNSSVNFRGVMSDQSSGSFFGKVRVKKERKQTTAFMQNKNLLLSDDAKISTVPILEIYNDDTECSHSATSGSLDKEKLFYLKSRGINESEAKDFLIKSFIDEITNQIKRKRVREYINILIDSYYSI